MSNLGRKEEKKHSQLNILTKETLGVILILFASLATVCLITRDLIFSIPGKYVNSFLFGVFGYYAFVVQFLLIFLGVCLVSNKSPKISKKVKWLLTAVIISVLFLLHSITTINVNVNSYGEYLAYCYNVAESGISTCTGGGLITGLVCYLFTFLLSPIGAIVVFSIFSLVSFIFLIRAIVINNNNKVTTNKPIKSSFVKDNKENKPQFEEKEYPFEVDKEDDSVKGRQQLFVVNPEDFALKTKRDIKRETGDEKLEVHFTNKGMGVFTSNYSTLTSNSDDDIKKKLEYVKTPVTPSIGNINKSNNFESGNFNSSGSVSISEPIKKQVDNDYYSTTPFVDHAASKEDNVKKDDTNDASANAERYSRYFNNLDGIDVSYEDKTNENKDESNTDDTNIIAEDKFIENEVIDENKNDNYNEDSTIDNRFSDDIEKPNDKIDNVEDIADIDDLIIPASRVKNAFDFEDKKAVEDEPILDSSRDRNSLFVDRPKMEERGVIDNIEQPKIEEEKEDPYKNEIPASYNYVRPPLELLNSYEVSADAPKENHEEKMAIIQRTLETFKINTEVRSYIQGPSITRYELEMPDGVSVKKVLAYDDDLKMRLSSKHGIRIEAPIPGKDLVGVEVANKVPTTVGLKDVLVNMNKGKPTSLMFALGKDIVGNSISDDLTKGPHYLVAGATGSGKSVCLNVMIISLIMRYSPSELRLILVDPKSVGFRVYEHLPHLLIDEIIKDPKRTVSVLQWLYEEMERRYDVFKNCEQLIQDIDGYNTIIAKGDIPKMPRIVVIIDELADLMETCKRDMESKIRALAQKSRAAGIHLVLATQRPSVDIVTGTIKVNLPSRIALKVMNAPDSMTILSEAGAEKLLGNGDMLYKNSGMSESERYQGAWISDIEISNIVSFIKQNNGCYFRQDLVDYLQNETAPQVDEIMADGESEDGNSLEKSDLFIKALSLAVNSGSISISQLQRRFQIGYAKAGGLIDKMELLGFISSNEGSKARKVMLSREDFERRYGSISD